MDFFEFGKIYILESLVNEWRTGQELYDSIIKTKGGSAKIDSELLQISNKQEWESTMVRIVDEVKSTKIVPIIHLELHGSSDHDGIVLSSNELVSWEEFIEGMRQINIQTENNLLVTMGVCFGMDILRHISFLKPSPFFCIIASLEVLVNEDIYIRYSEFYNELLQSRDFSKSLIRLFDANPGIPNQYSFVNAPELFRKVYKNYLETQFTDAAIEQRAQASIAEEERRTKFLPTKKKQIARKFKKMLREKIEPYYREHVDVFLMRDRFESCRERFEIPDTTKDFLPHNWKDSVPNLINNPNPR